MAEIRWAGADRERWERRRISGRDGCHSRATGRLSFRLSAPLRCRDCVHRGYLLQRRDRKSTRLNSSHSCASRMPSSACKKKNKHIKKKARKIKNKKKNVT